MDLMITLAWQSLSFAVGGSVSLSLWVETSQGAPAMQNDQLSI